MAQMMHTATIIFDDNITSVTHGNCTWTSGETKTFNSSNGGEKVFEVALRDGYILDTVVLSNASQDVSLVSKTDSSFIIDVPGEINVTITLTSKKNTPTVKFLKHNGLLVNRNGKMVSNKEASSGETWVLNETLTLQAQNVTINFTSNNQNFTSIVITNLTLSYNDIGVYDKFVPGGSYWTSGEAYRTITFNTAPTGDLLTWLQANGTKQ